MVSKKSGASAKGLWGVLKIFTSLQFDMIPIWPLQKAFCSQRCFFHDAENEL